MKLTFLMLFISTTLVACCESSTNNYVDIHKNSIVSDYKYSATLKGELCLGSHPSGLVDAFFQSKTKTKVVHTIMLKALEGVLSPSSINIERGQGGYSYLLTEDLLKGTIVFNQNKMIINLMYQAEGGVIPYEFNGEYLINNRELTQ